MTSTCDDLVLDHLDYARDVCASILYTRRLRVPGVDTEDWVQEACVGLIQASRKYCPDMGEFRVFARRRVAGAVLDAARRYNPCKRWRAATLKREGKPLPQAVRLEDAVSSLACSAKRHDLDEDLLRHLSPLAQRVVRLTYEHGLCAEEVGTAVGHTKRQVLTILRRSLRTMRLVLSKGDVDAAEEKALA